MINSKIEIFQADYANLVHKSALVELLDGYARDPMGGGAPLSADVRTRLVPALDAMPTAFSLLALVGDAPAGLANCFVGFSTFAARPLVNIHDIFVSPRHRGRGVARKLFAAIEAIARRKGCCKLTLEVLSGNRSAIALYDSLGFEDYALDPAQGAALFREKKL
jgi:ribosomal protein S18 acetylase RimI-like enzyme